MQEGTATPETWFLCGRASAKLLHVMDVSVALYALEDCKPWTKTVPPTERPIIHQNHLHRLYKLVNFRLFRDDSRLVRNDSRLLDVLEHFRGLQATKPQDKVYAALSLSNDVSSTTIVADYKQSLFSL